MKQGCLLVAALVAMLAIPAWAQCNAGSKTVFSCTTTKGKVIELCDAGKTMVYSFGKPTQTPEIVVQVPRAAASTYQWQGVGRYMSYTVDIPNGDTVYSVFWGVDRLDEQHPIEAGVNVSVKQKQLASVRCDNNKKIVQEIEGINLKPTE